MLYLLRDIQLKNSGLTLPNASKLSFITIFFQRSIPRWYECCFRDISTPTRNRIWKDNLSFLEFGGTKCPNLSIQIYQYELLKTGSHFATQLQLTAIAGCRLCSPPPSAPPLPYWTAERTQRKTRAAPKTDRALQLDRCAASFPSHLSRQAARYIRTFKYTNNLKHYNP